MASHACPRCGFEVSRDRWWDRHPLPAVLFALPMTIFGVGAAVAYPWLLLPAIFIAGVLWLDMRRRRLAAIAARADYDHRRQMAALIARQHH